MSRLLAKSSGETLAEHTEWCLRAAKELLATLPFPDPERQTLEQEVLLAVALHDLGKAASGFQRVLRGEQKNWGGKRHEILSAAFASSLPGIMPSVLLAILTHHKALPSDGITSPAFGCLPPEQIPYEGDVTPIFEEMVQEWEENRALFKYEWEKICGVLGRHDLTIVRFELKKGLSLAREWLIRGSGKRGQLYAIPFIQRYRAALVRGLTIASDHLGSARYIPSWIPDLKSFTVLHQNPRPFQERVGSIQGSAILRAPTGSGKTEAALLWAQRNQCPNARLFYVLPYTASINAMYKRLGPGTSSSMPGVFGKQHVGLLHSRATAALYSMLESSEDDCSRLERQEGARTLSDLARQIWFPIRICTPHQILRYALRGKGWELMLAEFPKACFIFDEVHAYDPRMVGLTLATAKLANRWGARCLFMSATLPKFLEVLICDSLGEISIVTPDPSMQEDREVLDRKRHMVELREGNIWDNLNEILEAVKSEGRTLLVCNHVRTAQQVFDHLQSHLGDEVCLLHGRFNNEDRNRIESRLIGLPLPRVLIATQVVEVSLDVDFDQAFLEPAPIDAIIQRMGRVNRGGKRKPAKIVVFTKQVNKHHLYCECSGETHDESCKVLISIERLRAIPNPVSEHDLMKAADYVYGVGYRGQERQAFEEGLNHPDIADFEKRLLAGAHQDWVEQVIESTDGILEVLPTSLVEKYENKRAQGLWIEANALLVPIRVRSLSYLRDKLNTSTDPWTLSSPYSSIRGLEL
ncbi:MAG: CRISPR-associated helicase Cas3' [Nitrospirae bacterium]|nr:MAG: CRISPR-associated helicase Cas3' [Nitrospirota bacterium]